MSNLKLFINGFKSIQKNKIQKKFIPILASLFIFFLGAHFHKQDIWPFGQGYYASIKNIKKYGSIHEEVLPEEKVHEEVLAEEKVFITKTLLQHLSIYKPQTINNYSHLAILDENKTHVNLIASSYGKGIYKVNLNLNDRKLTEELIYADDLYYHDVLVTNNKRIFISYSKINDRELVHLEVAEIIKDSDKYILKILYNSNNVEPPYVTYQAGGKMIEFDNHHIMVALGDYQSAYLFDQENNELGNTILINTTDLSKETFTKGHRNPEGLVFSKSFKKIFETEHGPEGGDEINVIEKGNNYGWPRNTYGTIYRETDEAMHFNDPTMEMWSNVGGANFGNHDDFKKPIFAYIPSIGIKAIEQLPESQFEFPKWDDDFIICSTKGLHRVKITNSNKPRVLLSEQFGIFRSHSKINKDDVLEGCRDIAISENGVIFTSNDSNDLRIITRLR